MVNGCQKGKAGEREASHAITETIGAAARRGQQFSGSPGSPDIVTALDGIHFEVKRVENLNINKAMSQAVRDAAASCPVVMHRRNKTPWLITLRLSDWIAVSRIITEAQRPEWEF